MDTLTIAELASLYETLGGSDPRAAKIAEKARKDSTDARMFTDASEATEELINQLAE